MEPIQPSNEKLSQFSIANLTKVTTTSKYLALVLFLVLPFIGGWMGYNFGIQTKEIIMVTTVSEVSKAIIEVAETLPAPLSSEIQPYFTLSLLTQGVEGYEPPTQKITLMTGTESVVLKESEQNCEILTNANAKNDTDFAKNITIDGVTYDTRDVLQLVSCGWAGWFVVYALYQSTSTHPVSVLLRGGDEMLPPELLKVYPK